MVTVGDWIATGIDGEHWPIKAGVFARTYELAGNIPTAKPTLAEAIATPEIAELVDQLISDADILEDSGSFTGPASAIWSMRAAVKVIRQLEAAQL